MLTPGAWASAAILAGGLIDAARQLGYGRMVLDTLGSMTAARALLLGVGFQGDAPYYPNPGADVAYLELVL